jgi:PKD repeat protein
MRTTYFSLIGALALAGLAGCTVRDVDAPALAGPSTLAHSIVMVADRDTLTQNGADFTDIRITSISPTGVSETIPLRAQIFVDGVPTDFGTLSTKNPITPATIRYTAPAASSLASGQVPQTVTIVVTPTSLGDFRGEFSRQIDIGLMPPGVILPNNPNLAPGFTFSPTAPQVLQTVTFDASTTTNSGTACGSSCSYSWSFGDNTSGTGQIVTHEYRTTGTFNVLLTVTDARGASASTLRTVTVSPGTPPTATFTMSPTPATVNQEVFFDAGASRPAGLRRIINYNWNFGDNTSASGVATGHVFTATGTYTITLQVTDDAGAVGTTSQTLTVTQGNPTATMTVSVSGPAGNQTATVNVTATPSSGASITSYTFDWGDGQVETGAASTRSHQYPAGSRTITVTVTDNLGRQTVISQLVTTS